MKNGYIILSRKFFSNEFWNEERSFSRSEALIDLIQSARFEGATKILKSGRMIEVNRGELHASLRFLSVRWGRSVKWVKSLLEFLELKHTIALRRQHGETVITLLNYDSYNRQKNPSLTPSLTPRDTPSLTPRDTKISKENSCKERERREKRSENSDSFSFGDDWNLLLEKWKTLEGSAVNAEPVPEWLVIPDAVMRDFLCRRNEYGIEKLLAAVDLVRNSPYWQNRKIGLPKFLREETFLKLHDGSYEWNPDKPNNKPTKPPSDANERAKQRMREHHEQLRQNRDAG